MKLLTIRKYVTWNFLTTLFLCVILILGLTVMIDFVQRADDFLEFVSESNRTWRFIAEFYLLRLPMFGSWLFPIMLLTASGVSLIRMNRNNELIPLLMSGISIHQILLPMYVLFVAAGIGVFSLQEWVLPKYATRIARSKQLLDSGDQLENVLVVDDKGTYLQSRAYHPSTRTLTDVTLMVFQENVLRKIIRAESARWASSGERTWVLREGRVTSYDSEGFRTSPPETFQEDGYRWETSITPHQVLTHDADVRFHSIGTLYDQIRKWPHLLSLRMTLQARLVYPFITVLLPLFAMPVLLQREIKSYFKGGVIIAGIAIGFYLCQAVFMKMGTGGILHPIPASWTPLLLGVCLFVYLKDRIIT